MLPNSHDMNEEPRAGYGQPSAWSQRLGAGLAAASCCLLVLVALNANLSGRLRMTQPVQVSRFRLFTPSPPSPPPSTLSRSRTDEARLSPERRPAHPPELATTGERGGPASSPIPAAPAIASPFAVAPVSRPPAPEPEVAPPQAQDDKKQSALAADQRQLWARIAARKPAGIHLDGVATVRFIVGADGALIAVELAGSSGNAALDRLALRTVRNAAPFPTPPMGVESEQLVFTIPFSFH